MNSFPFFALTFLTSISIAQTSAELTCKAKAKEVAVQTYADCITTSKNAQIESVRSQYQEELAALKAKYDTKLKTISGDTAAPQKKSKAATLNASPAPIPVKGIAKQLPQKASSGTAGNIQNQTDETAVISLRNEGDSSFESEASNNAIEVIDMPVE